MGEDTDIYAPYGEDCETGNPYDTKENKMTSSTDNKIQLVRPIGSPEDAKNAMKAYQDTCLALLDKSDIQEIQGKEFKKKSAWRKLAKAFNLSTMLIEERSGKITLNGVDVLAYHFKARAIAPNGCFAEGTGSCDTSEKGMTKSIHNTRTIAETRAVNRAISSLIGSGEVSADEIAEEHGVPQQTEGAAPPSKKPAWVVGTCAGCGSDLCLDKNDKTKYYCAGYAKFNCKTKGNVSDLPTM